MAGKYFEELKVGDTFRHEVGRTITEADNVFFSTLTMNPQPPRPSSASRSSTAC